MSCVIQQVNNERMFSVAVRMHSTATSIATFPSLSGSLREVLIWTCCIPWQVVAGLHSFLSKAAAAEEAQPDEGRRDSQPGTPPQDDGSAGEPLAWRRCSWPPATAVSAYAAAAADLAVAPAGAAAGGNAAPSSAGAPSC